MRDVADLSPGTRLRADTSGWTYTVQGQSDERVVLSGPRGSTGVDRDKLQKQIASGLVEVLN